jgi:hypothetical protein
VAGMNLRGVRPAELRDLYRTLQQQGADLSVTRRSHVRIELPNGNVLTGPMSGSDRRGVLALRKNLRVYGRWDVDTGSALSDPCDVVASTTRKEGQ